MMRVKTEFTRRGANFSCGRRSARVVGSVVFFRESDEPVGSATATGRDRKAESQVHAVRWCAEGVLPR